MKKHLTAIWTAALFALGASWSAGALEITPSTDANALVNALGSAGVTVVGGTQSYTGQATQGGAYSGFNLSNGATAVNNAPGVVLTSGLATGIDLPGAANIDSSFGGSLGTAGDADVSAILANAGAPSSVTSDANILSFSFTVDPGVTSVSANFVFGTEEFPDQSVTDIFAFIVDGQNFAEFSDGSLISFQDGALSESFFLDNDVATSPQFTDAEGDGFQYDGFTQLLKVTGLLDPNLAVHTLKIVIADTSDTIFDSGVFLSGLAAGQDTGGGIGVIPLPASAFLLLGGLAGFGLLGRRRRAQA